MTPRLLIHERPSTGLEAKFSMPFCAAAALVFGHPTIDTFDVARIRDPRVQALMPRVTLRANPAFDAAAPLSQARVTVRLRDGRTLADRADGARGYPGRLTDEELDTKFLACAERSLSRRGGRSALAGLRAIDTTANVRTLTALCASDTDGPVAFDHQRNKAAAFLGPARLAKAAFCVYRGGAAGAGSILIRAPAVSSVSTYSKPSRPWRTSRIRCLRSSSIHCGREIWPLSSNVNFSNRWFFNTPTNRLPFHPGNLSPV